MPLDPTARALDLFVKLMRATRALSAGTEPTIAAAGLTTIQFGVLEALLHKGPLSHGELRAKVLTSPGNLTDVIDKLEARDLVARTRQEGDLRRVSVRLTPHGAALIGQAFPPHAARIVQAMACLDQTEQAALAALLRKLGLANAAPHPK